MIGQGVVLTQAKNSPGLVPFDPAEHLKDDAAIAKFLNTALEDGNPDVFLQAVRIAARAHGITKPAHESVP